MKKLKRNLLILGMTLCACASAASFAACKEDKAKLTFQSNISTVAPVELELGKNYTLNAPAEVEGYVFKGWYNNPEFSGSPVTSVTVNASQTFYAKWEKLYAVNLELDGGTLSTDAKVYLEAGANITEALAAYVPTKAGLTFGGWFDGTTALSPSKVMPQSELTLTAKYKVQYVVELWTEKIDGEGYEKVLPDVVGSEFVGTAYTSEQKVSGMAENTTITDRVTQLTLSETASNNVFKHYFDRMTFNVSYYTNYPDGTGTQTTPISLKYGEYVSVPTDYEYEGYCLMGWATSATGDVVYKTNYLESRINNPEEGETLPTADQFTPERHTTLFAVWAKGYTDVFGGDDYIFHMDENSKEVYLLRGGEVFRGEYNAKYQEFSFLDKRGDVLFSGKMLSESTYAYYNAVRSEVASTLYKVGEGLIASTKIYFDEYNGIEYVADGKSSNGTYYIDADGFYVATFVDGDLAGQTLTILTGTAYSDDGLETPAFQLRNEEEVALGSLVRFVANGPTMSIYSVYQLSLDGWGNAKYDIGDGNYATYSYTMDMEKQLITLINSYGSEIGVARVITVEGKRGYMFYEEQLEGSWLVNDTGMKLTLNGTNEGTLVDGNTTIKGYYTSRTSVFGGYVVTFTALSNKAYTFLVKVTIPEDMNEEDDITPDPVYEVTQKINGYAEYYYKGENSSPYYAPMIAVNDEKEGYATIYGYTSTGEYVKVSSGTFVQDEETKLYTFTREGELAPTAGDAAATPIDLTKVLAFTCALDTSATSYAINYWYSMTTSEGTEAFYEEYTCAQAGKNASLTMIAGLAIYKVDGSIIIGEYSLLDGVTAIAPMRGENVYLEIDENEKTFVQLAHSPYKAYFVGEDGEQKEDTYIWFDGKGGATYTVETDGTVTEEVVGTFTETEERTYGKEEVVYIFNATDKTFKYILIGQTFYVYDATDNGQYREVGGSARLQLDGYGQYATYTATDGTVYEGNYVKANENTVALNLNGEYRYFKLEGEGFVTFEKEYGVYEVVDNQLSQELYVEFDGKDGKLSVFTLDGETRNYITTEGTYTKDGNVFTLEYTVGGETKKLIGECDSFSNAPKQFGSFMISHKEVVHTFVTEVKGGWTVLILNDIGTAVQYDEAGVKSEGKYTIITETLLYYESNDGATGRLYEYDAVKGTATPIEFQARGYYTKDLEALLFSKAGFAIFNGGERYYYNIIDNNVIIYRKANAGETANEYGFYEDKSFGSYVDEDPETGELLTTKVFDGKTYYSNNGMSITFEREASTKDLYAIKTDGYLKGALTSLTFAPTGNGEFSAKGTVLFGAKAVSCVVTREIVDGETQMYVQVGGALGAYKFTISVQYAGEEGDNTYTISDMICERSADSYRYLDMYYRYYYFHGSSYASAYENNIGSLSITRHFDEEGNETECYVESEFGEGSEMYDLNGNLISFDKASYHEEKNSYPYAEFTAEDGFVYRLYFIIANHPMFVNAQGYRVYALTRVQEITTEDGYKITSERVITSEATLSTGRLFRVSMEKEGEALETEQVFFKGNIVSYVVRTKNDAGDITETKYYTITLTEDENSAGGSESLEIVKSYKSAEISVETVKTYYTEDGVSYVDVNDEGVLLMILGGDMVFVNSCEKTGENTYTVYGSDEKKYTITVEEDNVTIEQIIES